MLMAASGIFREQLIRDKSPNVTNITRDEADTLGLSGDGVSETVPSETPSPPRKKRKTSKSVSVTDQGDQSMAESESANVSQLSSYYSSQDSSHTKSAIADRLMREVSDPNYRERGSTGFHTSSLEFANTEEKESFDRRNAPAKSEVSSEGFRWRVDLPNYDAKDPSTWRRRRSYG